MLHMVPHPIACLLQLTLPPIIFAHQTGCVIEVVDLAPYTDAVWTVPVTEGHSHNPDSKEASKASQP